MGGFGAINLGLRHPEVFSSVFALSPGLFGENGLTDAMPTWVYENF
jgi:S-formylglutathione hydrolase FrmB